MESSHPQQNSYNRNHGSIETPAAIHLVVQHEDPHMPQKQESSGARVCPISQNKGRYLLKINQKVSIISIKEITSMETIQTLSAKFMREYHGRSETLSGACLTETIGVTTRKKPTAHCVLTSLHRHAIPTQSRKDSSMEVSSHYNIRHKNPLSAIVMVNHLLQS